jgi:hypothetical protein
MTGGYYNVGMESAFVFTGTAETMSFEAVADWTLVIDKAYMDGFLDAEKACVYFTLVAHLHRQWLRNRETPKTIVEDDGRNTA